MPTIFLTTAKQKLLLIIGFTIWLAAPAFAENISCPTIFTNPRPSLSTQVDFAKTIAWISSQERLIRPEQAEYTLNVLERNIRGIERQLAELPSHVRIVPTGEDLNHGKIMEHWGKGDYPMGLTSDWAKVDRQKMSPAVFASHDIIHATLWLKAVEKYSDDYSLTQASVLHRFEMLNENLLRAIDKESDPAEKLRLEYLWFHLVHESNLVLIDKADFSLMVANGKPQQLLGFLKYLEEFEGPAFINATSLQEKKWEKSFFKLQRLFNASADGL